MKFKATDYLNLEPKNYTKKEIINSFLNSLSSVLNELKNILQPNIIFPKNQIALARKMKYLIVICCQILYSLTKNPVFIFNAEAFFTNEKIVTFDVLVLFISILKGKIEEAQTFSVSFIEDFISFYNNFKNQEYQINLNQLANIDFDSCEEIKEENSFIITYQF